jgi:hypothetical protein
MRRKIFVMLTLAAVALAPMAAQAQSRSQREDDQRRRAQADAERKKAEKEKQWSTPQAALPSVTAVGPCPFVKVLYDAARYQEFVGPEAANNVAFTGEIQGVQASCEYRASDPIRVELTVGFAFGRGPKAGASQKSYPYWIAVTERNKDVLAKQAFSARAEFPSGEDRVNVIDETAEIVIPRTDVKVSGSNFEILVGFDVTPEMAEFNRLGKRFRVNAGATVQQAAAGTTAAQ